MSRTLSPSTSRPYGVHRVAQELEIPRSTFYAIQARRRTPRGPAQKRGPRTPYSDQELTERIRQVLAESPFLGEGHRKVWARLRWAGIRTSTARVLRLMREAGLLAPSRPSRVLGPRHHDGTIVTEHPNQMWGTDLTTVWTRQQGQATVFVAVDHCTAEAVGIHAAQQATHYEALEPVRQGIRSQYGVYEPNIAQGLQLRPVHGSQYLSDAFQKELRFLGIQFCPAFVRSPEGNGCAERFIRTLKEQLLWVRVFDTIEDLRLALHDWVALYNRAWMIERHQHKSPTTVRRDLLAIQEAA